MYNANIISLPQITDHFLPKIAREYNIISKPETYQSNESTQTNSRYRINHREPQVCSPLISAGWFSSLFSNNNIHVHSQEDSSKKEKEKERTSTNVVQLIILGSATAISTAFGLGKLRSSIVAAEENILYGRDVIVNSSNWNRGLSSNTAANILNVANRYCSAETDRKEKLHNYQYSLIGIATGILATTGVKLVAVGVLASGTVELIAIIGVITAVASAAFGAYQVAIHWDDFSKAQEAFKSLNLVKLIPQRHIPSSPPPAGWRI